MGTATICLHGVLILLQLLILRRRYDPVQLLQLPVALVFGYLTDLGVWVIQGIPVPSLWGAVAAVPGGGVPGGRRGGPEVVAGVVTLAGEGFVLAVCRVTPFPFGNLKVAFDVLLVGVASLLSLLCLHGLYGVREGTLAAALGVGLIAKRLQPPLQAWFTKRLP
ncbi:MAG: YitT family protein [Evtepia gabavorous]